MHKVNSSQVAQLTRTVHEPLGSLLAVRALEHAQHISSHMVTKCITMSPDELIHSARESAMTLLEFAPVRANTCFSTNSLLRDTPCPAMSTPPSWLGSSHVSAHTGPCESKWGDCIDKSSAPVDNIWDHAELRDQC